MVCQNSSSQTILQTHTVLQLAGDSTWLPFFFFSYRYIIGQFAFGHAETLGPLYTALGLFIDPEPPKASNFREQQSRTFRSSLILPFGANLQLILYECEPQEQYLNPEDESEHIPEYYIKLLVNEKPQKLPGCEEELCPYTTVRDQLKEQVDHCNFVRTCKMRQVQKDEL